MNQNTEHEVGIVYVGLHAWLYVLVSRIFCRSVGRSVSQRL